MTQATKVSDDYTYLILVNTSDPLPREHTVEHSTYRICDQTNKNQIESL